MHDWDAITRHYPVLAGLPGPLMELARGALRPLDVPAGTRLFDVHMRCEGLPLLLSGRIRVARLGDSGREIALYRVEPGESCIVTVACLGGGRDYDARGVAETACHLELLPEPVFRRLLAEHEPFRRFVFGLFAERMASLMQLVEEVAFRKLDQRLARRLLQLADAEGVVRASHQQLADELGSVREIVSRVLKQFEHGGGIALGRQQIQLRDRGALVRLAEAV